MGRRFARRDRPADVYGRKDVALVTPEEAAALDAAARSEHAVPVAVLMEAAGRSAAQVLDRLFPWGEVALVAGSGNNGADALVVARTLHCWGRTVHVIPASDRPLDTTLFHGAQIDVLERDAAAEAFLAAHVIVDGLLGTGARGPPRPPAAHMIDLMNGSDRPVLALDLPSGANATTGQVEDPCVEAAATVTFGWPKIGLMMQPARGKCGRIVSVEIGFPPLASGQARAELITPSWASAKRPRRSPDAHKGNAGRLLILAGGEGMAGAAVIAAEAARASGAGLVRLATAAKNRAVVQVAIPEATWLDMTLIPESDVDTVHALVAGPGLGRDSGGRAALAAALDKTTGLRTLLDADALNIFAEHPDGLVALAGQRPLVITPHAMELQRLTGRSVEETARDRAGAARLAAARFGCVVLLKGMPSLVASPDGRLLVSSVGSSDLATGGMGDQLAGVIGAFLAAGLDPFDAAGCGLFFAGRAADLARRGASLSPRDVSAEMHQALLDPGPRRSALGLPFVTFDQPPRR